jgi:peptide/nickel transport system ATP-binding protein
VTRPILQISGLRVDFPTLAGTARILRHVDLALDEGDVLGLVGESGSGKSMTALAAIGMVPAPGRVAGSIKVAGQEIVGRPSKDLRDLRGGKVAMVFQNPMRSLNPFFTVGRQMTEIIRRHRGMGLDEARRTAMEELDKLQMPDPLIVLEKYPHQLSGGQNQRVMIAIANACRPLLLIADEPTTALDVTVQAQIVSLLKRLSRETGLTVLFISHDLGLVSALCNKVAVMYAGRIVEIGPVADVLDQSGHPYTAELVRMVPEWGRGRADMEPLPGQVPNPSRLPPGCSFQDRCQFRSQRCGQVDPALAPIGHQHKVACHHGQAVRLMRSAAL